MACFISTILLIKIMCMTCYMCVFCSCCHAYMSTCRLSNESQSTCRLLRYIHILSLVHVTSLNIMLNAQSIGGQACNHGRLQLAARRLGNPSRNHGRLRQAKSSPLSDFVATVKFAGRWRQCCQDVFLLQSTHSVHHRIICRIARVGSEPACFQTCVDTGRVESRSQSDRGPQEVGHQHAWGHS